MNICILLDRPRTSASLEGKKLWGIDESMVMQKCTRAGFKPENVIIDSISPDANRPCDHDYQQAIARLNDRNIDVLIPLDELALNFTTGKKSIFKWHMSPLETITGFKCRKAVPTFHPDQIKKDWPLGLYFEMALQKAAKLNPDSPTWVRKEKRYLLDPGYETAIATLEAIMAKPWHSIDIETGRNQINTFGVAWSESDAIAIKMLPDSLPPAAHHKLWSLIAKLCQGPSKKVMQNGIYERMYLSRYGITIENFAWDTMCAMKFLWPELEKGLDNVGRIYTNEPYWKDDGRVSSEEGKQKDWGNIRDWPTHLRYNCDDTANTLEGMHGQQADLKSRGMVELYTNYIRRLFADCTYEMGARGLPLNTDNQKKLVAEYEAKSKELVSQLSKEINPRSSKQKLALLRDQGLKLPKKKDKKKGGTRESADELSLKKMRLSYPDNKDLKVLLEVASIEKGLSSYLRVRTFPDNRIRFSVDAHGTETGRFSCNKDPWDRGFNAQTMTDYTKEMIEWLPELDRTFVEVDLRQAETRFVAYDACDATLLGMLERNEDIHRYVAAEIYKKSIKDITHDERQLGKKSGHGANYAMGVTTFMDSCLKEMDLVLDRTMATRVLEAYHRLFPGIRRWHKQIQSTVFRERKLSNPFGRVRYFYGRTDDNTFREAYAYRPQSTVPDIANHLMLKALDKRTENSLDFWLHLQTHDSVLFSCKTDQKEKLIKYCLDTTQWHPEIILPAGRLVIPTEVKWGRCLGKLTKVAA